MTKSQSTATELKKIQQAIGAQENLRGILPNEQIEAALATLRQKEAMLLTQAGSGAVAQGEGATAIGERGVNVHEADSIITGDHNRVTKIIQHLASENDTLSEQDLRRAMERYLKWVNTTYSRLDLRGVEEREQKIHRLTLTDVYVSLRATVDNSDRLDEERHAARRDPEREANRTLDMRELLGESRNIAITGGPGCGKTTFLRIIASSLAEAQLTGDMTVVQTHLGLSDPLPVPIFITLGEYNRYRRKFENDANPVAGTVRGFINREVKRQVRHLPNDFFDRLLDGETPVMVLLDGLDEVANDADRRQVSRELQMLIDSDEADYIVVTSRTRAYEGQVRLADLRLAEVEPMSPEQVTQLVGRWCMAVYDTEAEIEKEATSLDEAIRTLEARREARNDPPLVDTPLMVTVVSIVHYNEHRLPEQRAALYQKCVNVLLAEKHHAATPGTEDLREWGGTENAKRQFLAYLAFQMMTAGEQAGRTVAEHQLKTWLQPEFEREYGQDEARDKLREFMAAMRSRESLIKEVDRRYSFVHLTFQEFLAAYYLAETVRAGDKIVAELTQAERAADSWWRETVLLTVGYLGLSSKTTALSLARQLGEVTGRDELQLAAAELAATAFVELESKDAGTRQQLQERLIGLLTNPVCQLQAGTRLLAGDALARLGDKRPGVGLRADGLPDIAWGEEVPAGTYTIGDDNSQHDDEKERVVSIEKSYRLAKYLVTYAQFQAFVAADDFEDARWWTGMPSDVRNIAQQEWPLGNRPRERVSWYQAVAFCRWLNDKLKDELTGQIITLPHEHEWEVAARFNDGRVYPWGDEWDSAKVNSEESGLGQTTAVGIFPAGLQPQLDLYDLSGNVWEWCDNKYHDVDMVEADESGDNRTLRGGSWGRNQGSARASCRYNSLPYFRSPSYGFRVAVCLSSPIS